MKLSPKIKCCDIRTNSLKQYHKKCMKNSVEKMHVDVGSERDNEGSCLRRYISFFPILTSL